MTIQIYKGSNGQEELIKDVRANLLQLAQTPREEDANALENRTIGLISQIFGEAKRGVYEFSFDNAIIAHEKGNSSKYSLPDN